jgi:hypothetical protein
MKPLERIKKNKKINLCDLELAKDFLKNIKKEKTDTLEFFLMKIYKIYI